MVEDLVQDRTLQCGLLLEHIGDSRVVGQTESADNLERPVHLLPSCHHLRHHGKPLLHTAEHLWQSECRWKNRLLHLGGLAKIGFRDGRFAFNAEL